MRFATNPQMKLVGKLEVSRTSQQSRKLDAKIVQRANKTHDFLGTKGSRSESGFISTQK